MFHPDKHSMDPNKQKWAEQIFNKVKEAYEVLSDSHKRAIYDTLGKHVIIKLRFLYISCLSCDAVPSSFKCF